LSDARGEIEDLTRNESGTDVSRPVVDSLEHFVITIIIITRLYNDYVVSREHLPAAVRWRARACYYLMHTVRSQTFALKR